MPWNYDSLPRAAAAVYRLMDVDETLLYVGIAREPFSRLRQHERKAWWPEVSHVEIEWFDTWSDASDEEIWAIREQSPVHNIQGRGGPRSRRRTPSRPCPVEGTKLRLTWVGGI